MPRLGAHMSIAGGIPNAVDRARLYGCETMQIFTKNASQWRARPLEAVEVRAFRQKLDEYGIRPAVSHASYLINLATAHPALRAQSIAAFEEELTRAETLGLFGLVLHPGSYAGGSEADGLRLVADAIRQVLGVHRSRKTCVILEHTAGQGTSVGWRFEHLAAILEHLGGSRRVVVCLDTCHLLAAGYDICSEEGYRLTFDSFDRTVGRDRLALVHLNDSKRPCQSRVDRHEHIGKGCLGLAPFKRLLNDPRFAEMPMLIETPKSEGRIASRIEIDPLDAMNLKTLRDLLAGPSEPVPSNRSAREP